MSFEIKFDQDLSLEDIRKMTDDGYHIARSAHAGNQPPYHVLLPGGVNFINYPTTIRGDRPDLLYSPHEIVTSDCEIRLLNNNNHEAGPLLSTHVDVNLDSLPSNLRAVVEKENTPISLAKFHELTFKALRPNLHIQSYKDYLYKYREQIIDILRYLVSNKKFTFYIFDRYIRSSGIVGSTMMGGFISNDIDRMLHVTDIEEGYIWHNVLNIIFMTIISILDSSKNENTVRHLAGTGMSYTVRDQNWNRGILSEIWNTIVPFMQEKYSNFPSHVEFVITTVGFNNFVAKRFDEFIAIKEVFGLYKLYLEKMVEKIEYICAIQKDGSQRLTRDPEVRRKMHEYDTEIVEIKERIQREIARAPHIIAINSEGIGADPLSKVTTHYDFLLELYRKNKKQIEEEMRQVCKAGGVIVADGVYTVPQALMLSMKYIDRIFRDLNLICGRRVTNDIEVRRVPDKERGGYHRTLSLDENKSFLVKLNKTSSYSSC